MIAALQVAALLLAPAEPAISWHAPESCPDATYVRERVGEQLRGVEVEPIDVRARVFSPTEAGARWHMQITIGEDGERELQAESCAALADAAAVMIAISVNATVEERNAAVPEPPPVAEPARSTEPSTAPAPAPEPTAEPPSTARIEAAAPLRPPSPAGPSRRAWAPPRAVLGVTTGLHGVGLPAIGAGVGGFAGVRWGPLRVAVTGTHWIGRERAVVDEITATYRLGTGGLDLCGVLALGRIPAQLELLGCVQAEAGVLRAQGHRASPSRTLRDPWVAVGGGAGALWAPRSWLAVGVRADVVAPLLRREFVIGDLPAGAVGPVDARGTLVVELRFPRIREAR